MTPAELKTLLESTGQTIDRFAKMCGNNRRTVERWLSGKIRIPNDAQDIIRRLDAQLTNAALYAAEQMTKAPEGTTVILLRYNNDNDLARYRPKDAFLGASGHAALIDRIRRLSLNSGTVTRITFMDPAKYEAWLNENSETDSEISRAEWAAETFADQ